KVYYKFTFVVCRTKKEPAGCADPVYRGGPKGPPLFGNLATLSVTAAGRDSSPTGGAKCTAVNHGRVCGKAKSQRSLPYHYLAATHGRALASPCGGGVTGRASGL